MRSSGTGSVPLDDQDGGKGLGRARLARLLAARLGEPAKFATEPVAAQQREEAAEASPAEATASVAAPGEAGPA